MTDQLRGSGFQVEADEMGREMMGLKMAVWEMDRSKAEGGGEEEEEEESEGDGVRKNVRVDEVRERDKRGVDQTEEDDEDAAIGVEELEGIMRRMQAVRGKCSTCFFQCWL